MNNERIQINKSIENYHLKLSLSGLSIFIIFEFITN